MSLEDLLDEEPSCTLLVQQQLGAVDENGIPKHSLQGSRPVQGRMTLANASQKQIWFTLGIVAEYSFTSLDSAIQSGMFILTADNRLFRVEGTRGKEYGKGQIPSFMPGYPCSESSSDRQAVGTGTAVSPS